MDVRVLVVMGRHVQHLQARHGVVGGHRRHALRVEPLVRQPLGVAHLGPLQALALQPLALQRRPHHRVELGVRVRRSGRGGGGNGGGGHVGERQRAVPGEMFHGAGGSAVQAGSLELRRLHLEARLHALADLPLSQVAELALPQGGVVGVQARHGIGQQGIARAQGHEEGVVAVVGRHHVRPGILAEGAQGGGVRSNVGGYGSHCGGGRGLKVWAHVVPMGMGWHRGLYYTTILGRARGSLREGQKHEIEYQRQ